MELLAITLNSFILFFLIVTKKVFFKGEFSEPTFLEFKKAQGLVPRLFLFLVVINGLT